MIFERHIVEALECLNSSPWKGEVFRHMLADFEPDRENVKGARWNPPSVPAIYASLERETCLAEANYHLGLQPVPVSAKRNVYRIRISLTQVLDLTDWTTLNGMGINQVDFVSDNYEFAQKIGGAAEWLKHDGILVPSARGDGRNLVIFPRQQLVDTYEFSVLDRETLVP